MQSTNCLHTLKGVQDLTRLSKTQLYRLIAAGDFPKPIKIENHSRWTDLDIQDWIQRKREETYNCDAA